MSYTEATGVAETSRKRARTDEFGPAGGAPAHEGGVLGGGFQQETGDGDDDDGDEDGRDKKTGRRKIKIEFINDKSRRHITFSKRKAGIMKKAYELSTLTGTQVLLLVVSETGLVYTFTTSKLQPLVTQPEGKNLIQACLNAPTNPPQPNYMQPPPPHPTQMQMPPPQQHAHVHAPPYPQQQMPPHIQQQLHDEDERSVSPHSQHAASANGASAPPPAPTQRGGRPRRAAAAAASYREESPSEDPASSSHGANGNSSSGRSDPPSQSYGNGYGGGEAPISQGYPGMQGFPPAPNPDWNYGRRG